MPRIYDNNVANYLKRASTNFGLNGRTQFSCAFWMQLRDTGNTQRLVYKENAAGVFIPFRFNYDQPNLMNFAIGNSSLSQSPSWEVAGPAYITPTRVLFAWRRNAITVADAKVYFNGVSQTITTFAAGGYTGAFTILEDTDDFYCGIRGTTFIEPMNGVFGWETVWTRELDAAEALRDAANPLSEPSAMVHSVEGCDLNDKSASGLHMSVNGTLACAPSDLVVFDTVQSHPAMRVPSVMY